MSDETAAFFDLDKTLIDVNSGLLWANYERRQGNISLWQFTRAAFWNLLYHLSLIDMHKAFDEAVAFYEGDPFESLDTRTREWFLDEIAHRIRPGAEEAVAEHRRRGHDLVILTNSTCFEAKAAAEHWEFDDWLANEFPTDDRGRLTGTFASPLCYAAGKVHHAEDWADERGIALEESYFYTDSYSDLPMLEAVGHPYVVAPDPRLKREADRRGWEILEW